jgi:catechol 2,3-dioxygenase-like lactoylglutathione lyase family enzyme
MDWTLEVVVLPVRDIHRSIEFYRDQVGFILDHHTHNEHMNVAQLTPPGSGCSIVFGDLPSQNQMVPGSLKALQLVVADAAAAREELLGRGVEVSELSVIVEADGGTFFGFSDPDGNSWTVQEIKARARKPLIPKGHLGLREWAGGLTAGRSRSRSVRSQEQPRVRIVEQECAEPAEVV